MTPLRRLVLLPLLLIAAPAGTAEPTWANIKPKLEDAFRGVPAIHLPGRTIGILAPADPREDLLSLAAFGHSMMDRSFRTIVFLMQAPADYPLDGVAVPGGEVLDSRSGLFPINTALRDHLATGPWPARIDPLLFTGPLPAALENHLALFKFSGPRTTLTLVPMYVRFSDASSQVRDLAPALVDRIREAGADNDVTFIVLSNLTHAASESALIQADSRVLRALRNLDIDELVATRAQGLQDASAVNDTFDALLLGALTLRWFGADHGELAAYAHSGQLVLTKDKSRPEGYASMGFASGTLIPPRIPHVDQRKIASVFDELFRSDILRMTRQTVASALSATAAHPPSLPNPQAAKKWPVYVSIFDAAGKLAGMAGSHVAVGPLEESLRRFTVEAVRAARPGLKSENAKDHVIEVSIPYGFESADAPDEFVPLLHGAIITVGRKTAALPPVAWRAYPDPHQLLGEISHRLGERPWAYALDTARLESFRILAFNEKEPFVELDDDKKKKKKGNDDDLLGEEGSGGSGGGLFTF